MKLDINNFQYLNELCTQTRLLGTSCNTLFFSSLEVALLSLGRPILFTSTATSCKQHCGNDLLDQQNGEIIMLSLSFLLSTNLYLSQGAYQGLFLSL